LANIHDNNACLISWWVCRNYGESP